MTNGAPAPGWRYGASALAAGVVVGLQETVHDMATIAGEAPELAPPAIFVAAAIKYLPVSVIAAALLALGLAVLDRRNGGTTRFVPYAALVATVGFVCGAPVGHFAHLWADRAIAALGLPNPWQGAVLSWSNVVFFSLGRTMGLIVALSLGTLVYLYLRNARRNAKRLAAAQWRGAEAERRVLAEQLNGAQALIEPAFLFDTLRLVETLFERDPASAQRALDALIAYLRAALPRLDDNVSTLGQQAELVRARLEIERIRLGGSLRFRVDVPSALAARPLAPLLLLPLALNAVRHGIEPAGGGRIVVQARHDARRLALQVADTGPGRAAAVVEGAGLGGVRERLAGLYGDAARLALADRKRRGLAVRLEIFDGGGP